MKSMKKYAHPSSINTDRNPIYSKAIAKVKTEGVCSLELEHTQVKYLNNIIESDHGKLKRLIKPTLGFKSMKTAYAPLKVLKLCGCLKKEDSTFGNMGKVFLVKLELLLITYLLFKPLVPYL